MIIPTILPEQCFGIFDVLAEKVIDGNGELVEYVIENYAKFEVDADVYGGLLGKYRTVLLLWS